jgi:hypothetical protein
LDTALGLAPPEKFFIQPKLDYCEREIAFGRSETKHFALRRKFAARVAQRGQWAFDWTSSRKRSAHSSAETRASFS